MAEFITDSFDEKALVPLGWNDFEFVISGAKRISTFSIDSEEPVKAIEGAFHPMPGAKNALVSFTANEKVGLDAVNAIGDKLASFMPNAGILWGYKVDPQAKGVKMFVMVGE